MMQKSCKRIFWLGALVGIVGVVALSGLLFLRSKTFNQLLLLTHGPLAGNVTDSSASIWFRTAQAAKVELRYSANADLTNSITSPPLETNAKQDFQGQIALSNLQPETTYYYNVIAEGAAQIAEPLPNFKTFAPRGAATDFRFGILTDFGSLGATADEAPIDAPTFENLARENPAFVVLGGDFWHNEVDPRDTPLSSAAEYLAAERSRYLQMYSLHSALGPYDEFVKKILPNFPLVHFWDDHDIGRNNADKNFRFKTQARQALQESFPTYPLGKNGDWQFFSYGQADFFILDARSQRDSRSTPDGPDKSMLDGDQLGDAGQWVWLTEKLKASQARWKIILSPVVFNPTIEKKDAWYGYVDEHDALVNFVRRENIQGVFFVSGDAHVGALDDGTNAGLPEMVVPGPNMVRSCFTSQNTGSWSHGLYGSLDNTDCRGYGIVQILTNPDRAILQVKDEHGETKLEYVISLE